MPVTPPSYHEPLQIAQGETISFTKKLPNNRASAGWSLLYSIRGGVQAIEFTSTPSGDDHVILVPAATTEGWLPGRYQLQGSAVNTDGTNQQFYLNSFVITPDLSAAPADADLRTHAQKMLESIQAQLEQCAQNILVETTVEGTRILREKRNELLMLRNRYLQERRGEIALENAKNGRPTGRKIKGRFCITTPVGSVATQFGAGNSVFNTDYP